MNSSYFHGVRSLGYQTSTCGPRQPRGKPRGQGFTLLELTVYLGLFSFLVGTGVVYSFHILSAQRKMAVQSLDASALAFAHAKLKWYVQSADGFSVNLGGKSFTVQNGVFATTVNMELLVPSFYQIVTLGDEPILKLNKRALEVRFKLSRDGYSSVVKWDIF